jgi:flagellar motor switch protein FliG
MTNMATTFSPNILGGALRKGLQKPNETNSGIQSLDGPSRAAIVLMAIGSEEAGALIKSFSPEEAQKVSSLLATVRSLDREVMIEVLENFKNTTEHSKQVAFDPKSFVSELVKKFSGEVPHLWPMPSATNPLAQNVPALDLISNTTPEQLHFHLKEEHPQVVATLLSLIPTELSAAVLERFDEQTRSELVLRVALLDQVDPSALVELNDMLERTIGADSASFGELGGALPAAEILSLFSGGDDQKTLASIREHSPQLAEQIAAKMFKFDDFLQISSQSLSNILSDKEINRNSNTLLVALKGASPNVRDYFFENMSKSKRENLRFEMDNLPPVRVQEVESKQREVVQIARRLEGQSDKNVSLERMGSSASSGMV